MRHVYEGGFTRTFDGAISESHAAWVISAGGEVRTATRLLDREL
jgi:hypothetical protein